MVACTKGELNMNKGPFIWRGHRVEAFTYCGTRKAVQTGASPDGLPIVEFIKPGQEECEQPEYDDLAVVI